MARRNPEVDEKLREAALAEFMENGYRGASTRGIAARAGITTGALYTRYPDKEALFRSFLTDARSDVDLLYDMLPEIYQQAALEGSVEALTRTIRAESASMLNLILRHYDAFRLLFCCGEGSGAAGWYDTVVQAKVDLTLRLLRSRFPNADREAAVILARQQMELYPTVVRQGFSPERTRECFDALTRYVCAGWEALLTPSAEAE